MEHIPIAGPWISDKEISYVKHAAETAWYENANIFHERFENAMCEHTGRKYSIALPSCTSAIHLSLACLDIGPGDEVIVPDITWIASSAPIDYLGATTIFADIDPTSWCISCDSVESLINEKTKAVIVVNLYGNMANWDKLQSIADKHGVALIEDAAQSIGARYNTKPSGSFGLASTFSFNGTKTLTTGEGGMLLTDDSNIYERALFLRDHGKEHAEKLFWNTEIGLKYRMSSMQAALGLAQLERIDELLEKKAEIFKWYSEELDDHSKITLNYSDDISKNMYWMTTAIVAAECGISKETLIDEFKKQSIDLRPFFYPLSSLPAYKDHVDSPKAKDRNVNSYSISPYGVNLPSSYKLTKEQAQRVSEALLKLINV